MFDQRAARLSCRLKNYDRNLFVKRNCRNVICVYRNSFVYNKVADLDGGALYDLTHQPQFVLALTDNWKASGEARDWGSEIILSQLRMMDAWSDKEFFDKIDAKNEEIEESKKRDFRNKTEDYLIENRGAMQKAWDGINVGSLSKRERRKELIDKRKG